jgi:hypothetical protein
VGSAAAAAFGRGRACGAWASLRSAGRLRRIPRRESGPRRSRPPRSGLPRQRPLAAARLRRVGFASLGGCSGLSAAGAPAGRGLRFAQQAGCAGFPPRRGLRPGARLRRVGFASLSRPAAPDPPPRSGLPRKRPSAKPPPAQRPSAQRPSPLAALRPWARLRRVGFASLSKPAAPDPRRVSGHRRSRPPRSGPPRVAALRISGPFGSRPPRERP